MYGLKEAGKLAYDQLKDNLAKHGYHPTRQTPGLWAHVEKPTTFTLCVDDFGVKYYSRHDAEHLVQAVKKNYDVSTNWKGDKYCGLTIDWNYRKGYVDISMPGYVQQTLKRFKHTPKAQHAPHKWTRPSYGCKTQQPKREPKSPKLSPMQTTELQAVTGKLLYYARAVDPTMLPALNEIARMQSSPTQHTKLQVNTLLDYAGTHPNAKIRFHKSGMQLQVVSDAAYLVSTETKSRAAGFYTLEPTNIVEKPNGAVHTLCRTIKNIMSSAAEAEMGSLYINAKEAIPIRQDLNEMGHKQSPTYLETDNTTAYGILTKTLKPKLSRAFDMMFHWLHDRVDQKDFAPKWKKGACNDADYFSKHHPPWYHQKMRPRYLQT